MRQPKFAVGYECTPICDAVEVAGEPKDVLDITRHYEQFERDFDLQEKLGVTELRYTAGWDKVWKTDGNYDFGVIAPMLESMRRRGFEVTIDLCHHKAPAQIKSGFVDPEFCHHLLNFALEFQRAFPWIERYTIINEPTITALLHTKGLDLWGSHRFSDVLLNMARTISAVSRALIERNPNTEFFLNEPLDHDAVADPTDKELVEHVRFLHEHGRFGTDDLLLGKVNHEHPYFDYLVADGADPDTVLWFEKNPAVIYQRELDFYLHCFKRWFRHRDGHFTHIMNPNPPSLVKVINEYRAHLPELKFGIGETNVRGTVRDRLTLCKWVLEQAAAAGIERVAWWGLTDAALWGDANLTRFWRDQSPDPVGIYSLSDDSIKGKLWNRRANEFSETIAAYTRGEMSVAEMPAYRFTGELKHQLDNYARCHMRHYRFEQDDENLARGVGAD